MAGQYPHIIKKVAFELEMTDQSKAFEWQQTVSQWFWDQGKKALDKLFDELVSPNEVIQIDQLTIDLANIKPRQLNENLTQQLVDQLTTALKDKIRQSGPVSHADGQTQSLQQYTFEQWLHYLEYGHLPTHVLAAETEESFWSVIYQQFKENRRAKDQLKQLLLKSLSARKRLAYSSPTEQQWQLLSIISGKDQSQLSAVWGVLHQWLSQPNSLQQKHLSKELKIALSSNQWTTIVLQFSWEHSLNYSSTWDKITAAFLQEAWQDTPLNSSPDHKLVQSLDWSSELNPVRDSWQKLVAESNLSKTESTATSDNDLEVKKTDIKSASLKEGDSTTTDSVTKKKPSKKEAAKPATSVKNRLEDTSKKTKSDPKAKSIDDDSLQESKNKTTQKSTAPTDDLHTAFSSQQEEVIDKKDSSDTTASVQQSLNELLSEQAYQEHDFTTLAGDHFYVDAAGVILVHPFLTTLFTALELWKEDQFTSDHAQQRAVHIIHYLARGNGIDAREEEMLLAKLLCGRPFELPLEQIDLNDTEKTEADNMLAAVIQHWGAIGKASPEGIREGFFQREAKIEKKENAWQLTIERKAQDILLGKLPWGLSIIKLPWLKELVKVTW